MDYSLGEALWQCSNLFSNVKLKLSHKRIMLFTNEDNPHSTDSAKTTQARAKARDLRETGKEKDFGTCVSVVKFKGSQNLAIHDISLCWPNKRNCVVFYNF